MKSMRLIQNLSIAICSLPIIAIAQNQRTIVIHFDQDVRIVRPLVGFLGFEGRDQIPDSIIQAINPSAWRVGWQFQGGTPAGLNATIDKVEQLGAQYKMVMSDLMNVKTTDWTKFESDVKNLVRMVGTRAPRIVWEVANEPDNGDMTGFIPITGYYEAYNHAFKALREMDTSLMVAGPGFAFPSYDKYKAFLEYCRTNSIEVNVLTWHYTGWDPNSPEQQNWNMGRLREFITTYNAQKIKEIHCDEWGGPSTDPGSLHPGRAVVWFHYLENIYNLDRAGRANWGGADNNLGNIISATYRPYPVYHVYRFYGQTKAQTRLLSEGNGSKLAVLASRGQDKTGKSFAEILLGSMETASQSVRLVIAGFPMTQYNLQVHLIPGTNLDAVLEAKDIPVLPPSGYTVTRYQDSLFITFSNVTTYQAYHLRFDSIVPLPVSFTKKNSNVPSPRLFSSCGRVYYTLPGEAHVSVIRFSIMDVSGAVKWTHVISGGMLCGTHRIEWNDPVHDRRPASAGVYLVKMELYGGRQNGCAATATAVLLH